MNLSQASLCDLVPKLKAREISAIDVVEACLARIRARESEIRAWAHLDEAGAREAARALDAGPWRGLLHGIPVAIKDIFDTHDMPTEYGSPIYAGHRPAADAACVALLREYGAVVLGKTVTTEFAYFRPGATRNPRNPAHTPGGSSSGLAAAVADGMTPLAFGSQTAASLIRPASYCGVVGFKAAQGRFSLAGVKPLAQSLDSLGWLTRSVEDAAYVYDVLAGRAPGDPARVAKAGADARFRVGLCRTPDWEQAEEATRRALVDTAERLRDAGAAVRDLVLPEAFRDLAETHKTIMAYEAARALAWERTRFRAQLSPQLLALLEAGSATPFERYLSAVAHADACRLEFEAVLKEFDAILAPSASGEAPEGLGATGDPVFSRMWAALKAPSISLPLAHGPNHLPVGLQLVGSSRDEARLLGVGAWAMRACAVGPV